MTTLSYEAKDAPVYLREGEDKDSYKEGEGLKTITRLTALGSRAGTVQNYNAQGETILIPSPSNDPNDPLNWSQAYKWYVTFLVVLAAFNCNLTVAGPSIAILSIAEDFQVTPSKAAYLFSASAFAQGLSSFFWSPLVTKFGKRPIYVSSFIIYTIFNFAAGASKTWSNNLALRIIATFAAGAGEIMGPTTINDIWFVHERGAAMGMFTSFLSVGVAFGLFMSGFITQYLGWRYLYWIFGAIISFSTLLIIFTFPETTFQREPQETTYKNSPRNIDYSKRRSFFSKMSVYSGIHTKESFLHLFIRPFIVIAYPAVLWSTLVTAVTVGFLIAVTTNVAIAYGMAYHFGPAKVGLCFLAGVIGSILGVLFGGVVLDKFSQRRAKANGGVREPEMRLPAIAIVLVASPLALVLYGGGVAHNWHWIVPTIGLGLINFGIVVGTNVALVYAIDSYKPIGNEVVTAILGYKAVVGFLFSFYTNPWIMEQGYMDAYGEMAGITALVVIFFVPFLFYGKTLRQKSLTWKATRYIRWNQDRDDVMVEEVQVSDSLHNVSK
jgi:MFS family permease